MKKNPSHILISRTDSIGDVVLTLPVAKYLKYLFPGVTVSFLGKSYTRPVIEACRYVDRFMDVDDFLHQPSCPGTSLPDCIIHVYPVKAIAVRARQLRIPVRIGTTNRWYHWQNCNRLVRLSRKNSEWHEAQLNLKLLAPLGLQGVIPLSEIEDAYGLENTAMLNPGFANLLSSDKYNLILHPKSQGNGREWPLENYISLVSSLDPGRFSIFVSGTAKEQAALRPLLEAVPDRVEDITGKMDLSQFLAFIRRCDGLVASGTGPLHLAAASGIDSFGLYPPVRPVHPGRWRPVGKKARTFVWEGTCPGCASHPDDCRCMKSISPSLLKGAIDDAASRSKGRCA